VNVRQGQKRKENRTMDGPTLQIERLVRALQWALPLAEEAHEQHYPGETYDKDNYVARQVQHARDALKDANGYLDCAEIERLERLPNSGLY